MHKKPPWLSVCYWLVPLRHFSACGRRESEMRIFSLQHPQIHTHVPLCQAQGECVFMNCCFLYSVPCLGLLLPRCILQRGQN